MTDTAFEDRATDHPDRRDESGATVDRAGRAAIPTLVIGRCLVAEAAAARPDLFDVRLHVWNHATASLTRPPVALDPDFVRLAAPKVRRELSADATRLFQRKFDDLAYDLILMDFLRDTRNPVFDIDGGLVTFSEAYTTDVALNREFLARGRMIPPYSDPHIELWLEAIGEFAALLEQCRPTTPVVFAVIPVARVHRDHAGAIHPFDAETLAAWDLQIRLQQAMARYALGLIPKARIYRSDLALVAGHGAPNGLPLSPSHPTLDGLRRLGAGLFARAQSSEVDEPLTLCDFLKEFADIRRRFELAKWSIHLDSHSANRNKTEMNRDFSLRPDLAEVAPLPCEPGLRRRFDQIVLPLLEQVAALREVDTFARFLGDTRGRHPIIRKIDLENEAGTTGDVLRADGDHFLDGFGIRIGVGAAWIWEGECRRLLLDFLMHPWSGEAEVRCDGRILTFDLHHSGTTTKSVLLAFDDTRRRRLEITATGVANPLGDGSEVWLQRIWALELPPEGP